MDPLPPNNPTAFVMPVRGEKASPRFDKSRPRELSRYFTDLELLFPRAKIIDETAKKNFAVYYVDFETEQTWKTFPEFRNEGSTYLNFKEALLVHYPDSTGDYVFSIRDMDSLVGERQRLGIKSTTEMSEFHLRFLTITTWLIDKKQLGDLEQRRAYLQAFQPSLLNAINHRLQLKFPEQHPNMPLDIQFVYEAARFVLQSSANAIHSYFAPAHTPIILQRPPESTPQPPASSSKATFEPDTPIKQETYASLLAEINKTVAKLVGGTERPGRTARTVNCHMCGGQHYISACGTVDEYTKAGKCKRNVEGKVVLPSGAFVPKDITGEFLKDRIDEYHRRFPNQLGVVTLVHTIANSQNPPTATPQDSYIRQAYQLTTDDRIANLEAELFSLKSKKPAVSSIVRTRAQRARIEEVDDVDQNPRQATPVPSTSRALIVPPPTTTIEPEPTARIEEVVEQAPEHPYRAAKDAVYAPPIDRNVGAAVKPPTTKKAEPAYKTLPPVHDPTIAADVYKRSMEVPVVITQRELLSLAPEVRSQYRDVVTTRRVPVNSASAHLQIVEEEDDEPLPFQTFSLQHALHRSPPDGATVVADPIEAYYNSLKPGQKPDISRLTVALDSTAIRSIYALVDNCQRLECTVDPGCQIVAMAETNCHSLGLPYDPEIRLNMESANGTFDWSLGLARNVPLKIGSITLYFQIHIIKSPSFAVLLGRPFDVLTESVVRNFANEDQTITITDPNSGRQCTLPTFPRGCSHPSHDHSSQGFR